MIAMLKKHFHFHGVRALGEIGLWLLVCCPLQSRIPNYAEFNKAAGQMANEADHLLQSNAHSLSYQNMEQEEGMVLGKDM